MKVVRPTTLVFLLLVLGLALPITAFSQQPLYVLKGIRKYQNPKEPLNPENIVSLDCRQQSHVSFMSKDFSHFPALKAVVLGHIESESPELLLERVNSLVNCESLQFIVLDSARINKELIEVSQDVEIIFSQASIVEKCTALEKLKKVEVDYGGWNNPTDGLVGDLHFKRVLRICRHFDLCFLSEPLDSNTIAPLAAARTLISLDLTGTSLSEEEMNIVSTFHALEEVNFIGSSLPNRFLKKIPRQNLVSLELGGCGLERNFSARLSFPRLENLNLAFANLSENDFSWIFTLETLKSLKLTGVEIPDNFFERLIEFKGLTTLTLYNDFEDVEAFQNLVRARPDLRFIFEKKPLRQ